MSFLTKRVYRIAPIETIEKYLNAAIFLSRERGKINKPVVMID